MTYALPDAPDGLDPHEALELALSLLEWAQGEGVGEPEHVMLAYPVVTTAKDGSIVRTLTSVTVRRPKVRDLRDPKVLNAKSDMALGVELAKRLTGLPDHEFDALDSVDFERIGNVVAGFQSHSPTTGSSVE